MTTRFRRAVPRPTGIEELVHGRALRLRSPAQGSPGADVLCRRPRSRAGRAGGPTRQVSGRGRWEIPVERDAALWCRDCLHVRRRRAAGATLARPRIAPRPARRRVRRKRRRARRATPLCRHAHPRFRASASLSPTSASRRRRVSTPYRLAGRRRATMDPVAAIGDHDHRGACATAEQTEPGMMGAVRVCGLPGRRPAGRRDRSPSVRAVDFEAHAASEPWGSSGFSRRTRVTRADCRRRHAEGPALVVEYRPFACPNRPRRAVAEQVGDLDRRHEPHGVRLNLVTLGRARRRGTARSRVRGPKCARRRGCSRARSTRSGEARARARRRADRPTAPGTERSGLRSVSAPRGAGSMELALALTGEDRAGCRSDALRGELLRGGRRPERGGSRCPRPAPASRSRSSAASAPRRAACSPSASSTRTARCAASGGAEVIEALARAAPSAGHDGAASARFASTGRAERIRAGARARARRDP